MYEFSCEYCGTVKIVKYKSEIGRFCSHACANKGMDRKPKVDLSYDWKSFKIGNRVRYLCRYHEGGSISCADRNCAKCGWNPEVAQRRTQEKGVKRDDA